MPPPAGLHVGVIMDGNGRWAAARGHLRTRGHRAGAEALTRVVEAAPALGVGVLTVYAFSADNWRRPPAEVLALMRLFREYLRGEAERCVRNGVRLEVIGRRDRLTATLRHAIAEAEGATAGGAALLLRVALDYSARDAILRAAQCLRHGEPATRDAFTRLLAIVDHGTPVPPLDLLIRTGGERRLSDFLLWEAAYAELYFTDIMWPEFGRESLAEALGEYSRRERRFGAVPGAVAG